MALARTTKSMTPPTKPADHHAQKTKFSMVKFVYVEKVMTLLMENVEIADQTKLTIQSICVAEKGVMKTRSLMERSAFVKMGST